MEIANINNLFKRLKEEGIDFFDCEKCEPKEHWLCPEDWGARKKRSMLLEICHKLGINSIALDYFYPKRLSYCHNKRCLNPACFTLSRKTKVKGESGGSTLSQQDIEELAEQIDLTEWTRMGTRNYLEQFNMFLPPFLRITERTLEKAIEWKKRSEK